MLEWLNRALAPEASTPPDADPPDASPDLSDDFPHEFDPTRPASYTPEPPDAQLARVLAALERVADVLTPGTPGREGAEDVPELRFDRFDMVPDTLYLVPGNRRRQAAFIYNDGPGIVYLAPEDATAATFATRGLPIAVTGEREVRTTHPLRLWATTGTAVRILEESS